MEGLWSFAGSENNAHLALAAGMLPPNAVERLGCYEHVQCATQFGNRHIHIVGGAHMLDQTVEDVEMVIGLLKSQDRLAGIFLELCDERAGMLHDLQNPVPEVTLQPLSQILREQPLRLIDPFFWANVSHASFEACLRRRMGQEQAAAYRAATAAPRAEMVVLCDTPFSVTVARVMATAMMTLWPSAFARPQLEGLDGPWNVTAPQVATPDPATPTPDVLSEALEFGLAMKRTLAGAESLSEEELVQASNEGQEMVGRLVSSASLHTQWGDTAFKIDGPLLRERDCFLAHNFIGAVHESKHKDSFVAVVGAAHVPGVAYHVRRIDDMYNSGRWNEIMAERLALMQPWSRRTQAYDFFRGAFSRVMHGESVDVQQEWTEFLENNPRPPVLDARHVIYRSALAGMAALAVPSLVAPWLAWRWAKRRADAGRPKALRWFKRARVVSLTVTVAALSFEVYTANNVVNQTRVLQRRWRSSVLNQRDDGGHVSE